MSVALLRTELVAIEVTSKTVFRQRTPIAVCNCRFQTDFRNIHFPHKSFCKAFILLNDVTCKQQIVLLLRDGPNPRLFVLANVNFIIFRAQTNPCFRTRGNPDTVFGTFRSSRFGTRECSQTSWGRLHVTTQQDFGYIRKYGGGLVRRDYAHHVLKWLPMIFIESHQIPKISCNG